MTVMMLFCLGIPPPPCYSGVPYPRLHGFATTAYDSTSALTNLYSVVAAPLIQGIVPVDSVEWQTSRLAVTVIGHDRHGAPLRMAAGWAALAALADPRTDIAELVIREPGGQAGNEGIELTPPGGRQRGDGVP
jgi:hypothetical protein